MKSHMKLLCFFLSDFWLRMWFWIQLSFFQLQGQACTPSIADVSSCRRSWPNLVPCLWTWHIASTDLAQNCGIHHISANPLFLMINHTGIIHSFWWSNYGYISHIVESTTSSPSGVSRSWKYAHQWAQQHPSVARCYSGWQSAARCSDKQLGEFHGQSHG